MPMSDTIVPDFSMLSNADVVNLAMQRSSSLGKMFPPRKKHPDDWREVYLDIATKRHAEIVERIWEEIRSLYDRLGHTILNTSPRRVADIGCGQAFIDLLIHRDTEADLLLIDIEESDAIHFGFKNSGAGYASLDKARAFLEANGVPAEKIITLNPKTKNLSAAGKVDLALSLISCGFHYPVETYDQFFNAQVRKAILLDIRNSRGGADILGRYGSLTEVYKGKRHVTLLASK